MQLFPYIVGSIRYTVTSHKPSYPFIANKKLYSKSFYNHDLYAHNLFKRKLHGTQKTIFNNGATYLEK